MVCPFCWFGGRSWGRDGGVPFRRAFLRHLEDLGWIVRGCDIKMRKNSKVELPELPEDQAEVSTTALIIEGTTLIPALVAAITKGL